MNMQLELQQSSPIQWKVPQIPFVDRVLDILVMPQRRPRTVQTVQKLGDSTAQFLYQVDDARCCQRQVHGLVSAETCGGPAVCSI